MTGPDCEVAALAASDIVSSRGTRTSLYIEPAMAEICRASLYLILDKPPWSDTEVTDIVRDLTVICRVLSGA